MVQLICPFYKDSFLWRVLVRSLNAGLLYIQGSRIKSWYGAGWVYFRAGFLILTQLRGRKELGIQ